jgi:hypothetical protein
MSSTTRIPKADTPELLSEPTAWAVRPDEMQGAAP